MQLIIKCISLILCSIFLQNDAHGKKRDQTRDNSSGAADHQSVFHLSFSVPSSSLNDFFIWKTISFRLLVFRSYELNNRKRL